MSEMMKLSALLVVSALVIALAVTIATASTTDNDAFDHPGGWPGYSDSATSSYVGVWNDLPVFTGFRFSESIPQGAVITSAVVTLYQSGWGYHEPTLLGFDVDGSCAGWSPADSPADRVVGSEIGWTWPAGSPGDPHETPDLSSLVQEIVNGEAVTALCLIERPAGAALTNRLHSWSTLEGGSPATLSVSWSGGPTPTPGGPTPTPVPTATATATVTPVPTATSTPGPMEPWPSRLDLAVGETSAPFVFSDGVSRTVTLDLETVILRQHRVYADVTVTDTVAAISKSHRFLVGGNTVPVVVNGLRIFAYVWQEADDLGLEQVAYQGALPLAPGKSVGFLVSDPLLPMYPVANSSPLTTNAPNESGFFQNFLEPFNAEGMAHSGYDHALTTQDRILAPYDGTLLEFSGNFVNSFGETDGQFVFVRDGLPLTGANAWGFTHVNIATIPFPAGTHVVAGAVLATVARTGSPAHTHIGSGGHFDGGSYRFFAEMYEYHIGQDTPTAQSWLILPVGTSPPTSEQVDLPAGYSPRAGVDGWFLEDNTVHGIVNMGELVSLYPYTGHEATNNPAGTFGYQATHVWSETGGAGTLNIGVSETGTVWLNSERVWSGDSGRYSTYDPHAEPAILTGQFAVPVTLVAGWNTLVMRSTSGNGTRPWLTSIDVIAAGVIAGSFSTRPLGLLPGVAGDQVTLNWTAPDDYWRDYDGFKVLLDGVLQQTVTGTTAVIAGVAVGNHEFKVAPVNAAGDVYDRADSVMAVVKPPVPGTADKCDWLTWFEGIYGADATTAAQRVEYAC